MSKQLNVNTSITTLPSLECAKCGSKTFANVYLIKKLSSILSPDGKERLIPIQIFTCSKCGHIPEDIQKAIDMDDSAVNQESTPQSTLIH